MNTLNFLSKKSIRFNISVVLGMVSVIMIVSIIAIASYKLRQVSIDASVSNAKSLTANYAGKIKSELEEAVQTSEDFAVSFSSTNYDKSSIALKREQANTILKNTLLTKKNLLGTWTLWEPNAFDGNDSAYIRNDGHDSTGRFIPYWTKDANNQASVSPLTGYNEMSTGDWYLIPKSNQKQFIHTLTYPVDGKNVTMLTVVTPVMNNNKFYGVTGADISLDWLQTYVEEMQKGIFEGKSTIGIITQEGNIAALTGKANLIGQNANSYFKSGFQNDDLKDKGFKIANDTLTAYAPLKLGQNNEEWKVMIQIPLSIITSAVWNQLFILIIIGVFFLVLRDRIEAYLINKLTKPITTITDSAENIAIGEINYKPVDITSQEIGKLNNSFLKLVESQKHITEVCVGIADGNFDLQAEVKSESDALGKAVNKMINNLKVSASEDAKRNWSSDGLAKFAEILRSNNTNIDVLTQNLTSEIVKYINANQAALFLISDDNNSELEMVACYAYNRKKFLHKTISKGEGLAGQCFQEKARIYLTAVPENYIKITSGLGDATPRCVLVIPLLNNEQIEGVIEIASFRQFEEYEIQFIEKVGESIASTLTNIKTNIRTAKLLESTQMQAQQMKSQEEEMRQNLEEMTAIQEEMQRKENDYINRIRDLENRYNS